MPLRAAGFASVLLQCLLPKNHTVALTALQGFRTDVSLIISFILSDASFLVSGHSHATSLCINCFNGLQAFDRCIHI